MYENSDNNSSNCWAGNHNFPTSAKLILEENSLARYYLCEWFPVFLNQYVVFSTIPIRYYYFGISSHSVQFHQFFPLTIILGKDKVRTNLYDSSLKNYRRKCKIHAYFVIFTFTKILRYYTSPPPFSLIDNSISRVGNCVCLWLLTIT